MGPRSYMRSVVDRNVVMRRVPVHGESDWLEHDTQKDMQFNLTFDSNWQRQETFTTAPKTDVTPDITY